MASGPGPEAAPHHAVPSTALYSRDDHFQLACDALFTPYIVLCALPKQFNLSFINPKKYVPSSAVECQGAH